jgi:putative salt-induced outer membrane protein YdiY
MKPNTLLTALSVVLALWGVGLEGRADDVLIGTNGDRLTGKVIEETPDSVVFESELGGRLTVPRARIRELQRTAPTAPAQRPEVTNQPSLASASVTNAAAGTNWTWRPPGVGRDGSDWIELKSGEWLRGRLYYVQDRKVEFDSDEVKDLSLDLKDVRLVFPAKPLFVKFDRRNQIYGTVMISNNVVQVSGPEQVTLPRDQLTGITPGGKREIDFWSGNLNVSLSLQSGNTKQMTLSTSAELARRTPSSTVQLNYLANYSQAEGVQSANNQRINGFYDIRLNRHWFVRPAYLEYYEDQLANIALRGTYAVGVGYYIFDRPGLEWLVTGGPGFQYTKFETVETGQADSASTPAAVLQTTFKADITPRLKFVETVSAMLTKQEAGFYSHHAVSTFEFEIKRHLDLDVSFVWDYLQNPQVESSGAVPQRSDFRLNLGVGVKF